MRNAWTNIASQIKRTIALSLLWKMLKPCTKYLKFATSDSGHWFHFDTSSRTLSSWKRKECKFFNTLHLICPTNANIVRSITDGFDLGVFYLKFSAFQPVFNSEIEWICDALCNGLPPNSKQEQQQHKYQQQHKDQQQHKQLQPHDQINNVDGNNTMKKTKLSKQNIWIKIILYVYFSLSIC